MKAGRARSAFFVHILHGVHAETETCTQKNKMCTQKIKTWYRAHTHNVHTPSTCILIVHNHRAHSSCTPSIIHTYCAQVHRAHWSCTRHALTHHAHSSCTPSSCTLIVHKHTVHTDLRERESFWTGTMARSTMSCTYTGKFAIDLPWADFCRCPNLANQQHSCAL